MSDLNHFTIPELYRQVNHVEDTGIPGYFVNKKYVDPIEIMKSREYSNRSAPKVKKYETKRGNYLDDQSNRKKFVPGPGEYPTQQLWPKKTKSLHHASQKLTYIDDILRKEKREKKPYVGSYNLFKTDKEIEAEKKKLASKKIKEMDKINYLDHIQHEALQTPGVGEYNPRDRIKTETNKIKTKPEDWRKKHNDMQKNKKVPKMPDMRTYNPTPVDYSLFDSLAKPKINKNLQGKVERFKTQQTGSGICPDKYNILQEWRGKDIKKKDRHGLQTLSKGISKSVYYH